MATKTARRYSVEQEAYMVAKATYQTLTAETFRRVAAELDRLGIENEDEAGDPIHDRIDAEMGTTNAWVAFNEAEAVLLKWAQAQARRYPEGRANADLLDSLFTQINRNYAARSKVVALAMRLQA